MLQSPNKVHVSYTVISCLRWMLIKLSLSKSPNAGILQDLPYVCTLSAETAYPTVYLHLSGPSSVFLHSPD